MPGRLRWELASAYAAGGARVGSWFVVLALVFRHDGRDALGLLALVRATLVLLNYTAVGITPALIHHLPRAGRDDSIIYRNGLLVSWLAALAAGVVLAVYEIWFRKAHADVHGIDAAALPLFLTTMGAGSILRLMSDPAGALLQVRDRFATDNLLLTLTEILWTLLVLVMGASLATVGIAFAIASGGLLVARSFVAVRLGGVLVPSPGDARLSIMKSLVGFGLLVSVAQVADYLYAPTDFILIDRLLARGDLAAYAPAVQLDGGLLLVSAALASFILPRAAIAHAGNDIASLRRYYWQGTAASFALLLVASTVTLILSRWIFQVWFGNDMASTRQILPLVLISTVLGGSSAVGRSILLGSGRIRIFTLSVLIAGAANVIFSFAFVRFGHLGLKGIVGGTLVAVIVRCGFWMPWYVSRTLRTDRQAPADISQVSVS